MSNFSFFFWTNLNENVQLGFGLLGKDQVAAYCVAPQGLRHMGGNLKQTGHRSIPVI